MTRQRLLAAAAVTLALISVAGAEAASTATPPVSASVPTISGTAREGNTLTASSGSWGGSLPISYDYAWQHCDDSGSGCSAIKGANTATHKLTSTDVGRTLRVKVTATNSGGTESVFSAQTGLVQKAGSAPAATSQPSPSGNPWVGQHLTTNNGTWSGTTPMTFTYQWERCTHSSSCSSLNGATAQKYTVVTADVGKQLRYVVTAHNSAGKGSMNSNLTSVIAAAGKPPQIIEPPVIFGDPTVGKVVQVGTGVWSGIGKTGNFGYSWDRCTTAGACTQIPGATKESYVVAGADQGQRLRAHVTATNAAGSTTATSAQVAVATGGSSSGAVVPVTSLKANPDHLLISDVKFSPSPFGNPGGNLTVKVRVELEGTNKVVSGALVAVTCIPYNWVKGQPPETPTGSDGWATLTVKTSTKLPHSGALVMQVRARGPGSSDEAILGGFSTRRLVQVSLK